MNLRDKAVQIKMFKYALSTAVLTEGISAIALMLFNHTETAIYFLDTKPMNPSLLYMLASSAWAIALIALMLLITSKEKVNKIWIIFGQTGKMALSHYVFHFFFVLGAFELYDNLAYKNECFVLFLSLFVFLVMILFSNIWLKRFSRGPLEFIMRRMS